MSLGTGVICTLLSAPSGVVGDPRKYLQIADAQTVEEFQANNSHLGDQPEHNLALTSEIPNKNSGPIGLLSDTTGKLLPNLKRKNPSEELGHFLPDSELTRKMEKNKKSKKLKKFGKLFKHPLTIEQAESVVSVHLITCYASAETLKLLDPKLTKAQMVLVQKCQICL